MAQAEGIRARLDQLRGEVGVALARDHDGQALVREFSEGVRAILCEAHAEAGLTDETLVAVGSLAREELLPFADVDLVWLRDDGADEISDAHVRRLCDPLWEAGLRVSVVQQSPSSWFESAAGELTLSTALLDATWLAGPQHRLEAIHAATESWFEQHRDTFFENLASDSTIRRRRHGTTVYRVEPDLKSGRGALRDIAVACWSLKATHGHADLVRLGGEGHLPKRTIAAFQVARGALLRVAAALQLEAGRAQTRFALQYQDVVGQRLLECAHAEDPASECMRRYFQAATVVARYGERIFARSRSPRHGPVQVRHLDERFSIENGELRHRSGSVLERAPLLALAAFELASRHGVPLSGPTFDAVAEAAQSEKATRLRDDPRAHESMLRLLSNPDDAAQPTMLQLAAETALLEAVVPEFAPLRGRMQREGLHSYTVDQHTLYAIEFLKAIARGEHTKEFPLATAVLLELEDTRPLFLATLLHDVGKATDGDQAVEGAAIALHVAERMGFGGPIAERVRRLVLHHIDMPMYSQRRDLSDPALIERLAETVGDARTLRELYLLSLADMANVGPGNLTPWKLSLLDELFLTTYAFLRRGSARLEPSTPRDGEPRGLPERYYALFDVQLRQFHHQLIERAIREPGNVLADLDGLAGTPRLTIVAPRDADLLAKLMAVLDGMDCEVLAADMFAVPGPVALLLLIVRVVPRDGVELAAGLREAVEQALHRPLPEARKQPPSPALPAGAALRIPDSTVRFVQHRGEEPLTIVEIRAADQPGLLRRITSTFAGAGVEVHLARCASDQGIADDVFYVSPLSEAEMEQIGTELRGLLP